MIRLFRRLPWGPRVVLVSFGATLVLLTILCAALMAYLDGLPPGVQSVWFVNVKGVKERSKEDSRFLEFDGHDTVPLYLVKDGELYLMAQNFQVRSGILETVDLPPWDAALLGDFLVLHPELRAMLPDPDAPDGGVRWFRPRPTTALPD